MSNDAPAFRPILSRALVIVRGGVAEVYADPTVNVHLVDYDNEPDEEIPADYIDLISE